MRQSLIAIAALAAAQAAAAEAPGGDFEAEELIPIAGYAGEVMEPFLSRDGALLLFNDQKPGEDKDLHYATRRPNGGFVYAGLVAGANSPAVDGAPSLDRAGNLFFVSTRSYATSRATLYQARFQAGAATGVALVAGDVSRRRPLHLNMDAEISADGQRLYTNDNVWDPRANLPKSSDLVLARRAGESFQRAPNSEAMFAAVNSPLLDYAPAMTADELTLYFTRLDLARVGRGDLGGIGIYQARRANREAPFEAPARIAAITGFAEGPTVSADNCELYYHRKTAEGFRLFRVRRAACRSQP